MLAYLRNKGHEVRALDLNIEIDGINDGDDGYWAQEKNAEVFIEKYSWFFDDWTEKTLKYNPDIVGFNVWQTSRKQALFLADKIKRKAPGILIVFGGPEAVLGDKQFINEKAVDLLIKGEGEETFLEVIKKYKKRGIIDYCKGCYVRKDGEFIDCGKRKEIENLDTLPFPDFSDFQLDKYLFKGHIPISFSRGCRWRCSFCTVENCWPEYRTRSAASIYKEIKYRLREISVSQFVVCDPALNQDTGLISDLCDMIIAGGVNIKWDGMAQIVPDMTSELLAKMRKAGCVLLNYGVEHGSQKVLDSMGKKYDVEDAKRVIRDTDNAGIEVCLNFIVGYPNETEEDFHKTLKFVESVKSHVLNIAPGHPCLVLPYSRLYKYPDKYGIVFENGQWKTKNGDNTVHVREKRAREFDENLERLGIAISCGEDDRDVMKKNANKRTVEEIYE